MCEKLKLNPLVIIIFNIKFLNFGVLGLAKTYFQRGNESEIQTHYIV